MSEENKAVKLDYLLCRICLQTNFDKNMSLFEIYKESTIFELIMSIADVKISQADGLPDRICPKCLLDLETAISFKLRCELSDKTLHTSQTTLESRSEIKEIKEEPYDSDFPYDSNSYTSEENVEIKTLKTKRTKRKKTSLKSVHDPRCEICNETFKTGIKLQLHINKEHSQNKNQNSYTCDICKSIFKTFHAYEKHQTRQKSCMDIANGYPVRIEGEGKNRIFYCMHCEYSSNAWLVLKQHGVVHTGARPWTCDTCNKAYSQKGDLLRHQSLAHSNDDKSLKITCYICGKLLRSRFSLRKHLRTHFDEKVQCDICKSWLKSKKFLVAHLLRHGSKNITCEICAATFYSSGELTNHKKVRHSNLPKVLKYSCPTCKYRGSDKWTMRKHINQHANQDRPFGCKTCGRFFSTPQKLEIHENKHLESYKHKCGFCQVNFISGKSLNNHLKRKHNSNKEICEIMMMKIKADENT